MSETTTAGINSKGTAESDSANVKESENRKQTAGNGSKNKDKTMIAVNLLETLAEKSKLGHFYSEGENKCTLTIKWFGPDGKSCDTEYEGNSADGDTAKKNAATEALNNHFILKHLRSSVDNFEKQYHKGESETGYVLVVCFNEKREGSDVDVLDITRVMATQLNFTVLIKCDPTKKELEKILKDTASLLKNNAKDFYCFTFFIMGHGNEKGIQARCKEQIIPEEIMSHFKHDNMGDFAGKPRVFFMQACRGDKVQKKVSTSCTDNIKKSIQFPTDKDIFVAYSTTEGCVAYRDTLQGSHFIKECVTTFEPICFTMHLEDKMIYVRGKIAGNNAIAQMPCTTSTLTKPLYYRP